MRPAAHTRPAPRAPADAALEAQKRAFLRVVSHELRTPLNSILGFSEILASELYGPMGQPRYKEYAQIVRDSGEKLLRLVNQLLEIARLETQAVDWRPEAEPLGAAIDGVLSSLARDIAERAAKVSVADPLPEVFADARGLQTVLAGLIHNAILYSPPGSQVQIRARRDGDQVELLVENPGERLDPADLPRLLKPFEQGETALTRSAQGAGLGLPICAMTCRAMGGTLELRALPEGGLAACVRLPAA
ncbi:MAG TPA: HAMP domain-containing sensor histidine kinase [Phenylobacterium sp.]|nr:HAMP domain-containing sensor histidine kinase [Phenylobacterium sp.]